MAKYSGAVVLLLALVGFAAAEVFFEEKFEDASWESRWVKSSWKQKEGTAGDWTWTAGKFYGDEVADKGIQTGPDARFYAISSEMENTVSNEGKDLVLQFSVKNEQKLDCGGGYIKLLPATSNMEGFSGDTPYSIMFGPDICGYSTKRVHVIFTYKGTNLLTKKSITCETDELTHVYTLILKPDNTYKVLIDNVEKAAGELEADFDFLEPKTIKDPEATKPDDWDERAMIPDETDVKPEGYDDIPEKIVDPEASKPEDWDDEDDGEWEAPMIANAEYKGAWRQKEITNPEYKGVWEPSDIPNPAYEADDSIYMFKDLKYVGFELWQVKAGSIFDNILVTDDVEYAKTFAEDTWRKTKDAEKEAFDELASAQAKIEEEASKKLEDAEDADEEEDEEEDEYEDEADPADIPPEGSHDEL